MLKHFSHFLNTSSGASSSHSKKRTKSHTPKKYQATFDFLHLVKAWPRIVGEMLAQNTSPLKIQNKTLIILTKHSAFSQQLSFLSQEIIKKINSAFPGLKGDINKIYYKSSPEAFNQIKDSLSNDLQSVLEKSKVSVQLNKNSPHYRRKRKQAESTFQDIDDQEVKELLISLYIQSSENDKDRHL